MNIGSKIVLLASSGVLATAVSLLAVLHVQRGALESELRTQIRSRGYEESSKAAEAAYLMCRQTERQNERSLMRSLGLANERVASSGGIHASGQTQQWSATNQLTKETVTFSGASLLLGAEAIEVNHDPKRPTPIVDEITHLTGHAATIFLRINEAGDMMRVATSVISSDGNAPSEPSFPGSTPRTRKIRSSKRCLAAPPIGDAPLSLTSGTPRCISRSSTPISA